MSIKFGNKQIKTPIVENEVEKDDEVQKTSDAELLESIKEHARIQFEELMTTLENGISVLKQDVVTEDEEGDDDGDVIEEDAKPSKPLVDTKKVGKMFDKGAKNKIKEAEQLVKTDNIPNAYDKTMSKAETKLKFDNDLPKTKESEKVVNNGEPAKLARDYRKRFGRK